MARGIKITANHRRIQKSHVAILPLRRGADEAKDRERKRLSSGFGAEKSGKKMDRKRENRKEENSRT